MDDLIGTNDVAAILGISNQRVLQLVESGTLTSKKISYRHLFDRAEIEKIAAKRAAQARGDARVTPPDTSEK